MRFGIFYEHQLPRPWKKGDEHQLIKNSLDQVEFADKLGFDYVWEVEHHFLEEYAHSSAPEVFLAAASQRTTNIRLGHGIVQLPPHYNHPARVAERIATLDLVSDGRVDFGTGESSSEMEIGGFNVDRPQKRAQWEEALTVVTRLLVEEPFAGHKGEFITIPQRNLVPKPMQQPHPPLWVACSRRETIQVAASKGIGALTFSFVEPEEAKTFVDDYHDTLESESCVAAGFSVNPKIACVLPMMCHETEAEAIDRGLDGAHFFGYSLGHYYVYGQHKPGQTMIADEFEQNRSKFGFDRNIGARTGEPLGAQLLEDGGLGALRGAIGTPTQIRDLIRRYEKAGVDQLIFVSQAGNNKHEHIMESMDLFSKEVMGEFKERAQSHDDRVIERYGAAMEAALKRRPEMPKATPDYVVGAGTAIF